MIEGKTKVGVKEGLEDEDGPAAIGLPVRGLEEAGPPIFWPPFLLFAAKGFL